MRRWWLFGILGVMLLLVLAAWGIWRSEAFWRWSGEKLLALARERLQVEIQVGGFKGHPLTGLAWENVTVTTPQGELLFIRRLEMRLSLWSLVKGEPVIGYLGLEEPRLTLRPDGPSPFIAGREGPPPQAGKTSSYFKSLSLPRVVIKEGQVVVLRGGEARRLENLEGNLSLDLLRPGQPQQQLLLRRAALKGTTPWGPFSLEGRLAYTRQHLQLLSLAIESGPRLRLSLGGEVHWGDPEGLVRLVGEVAPVPGEELRRFLAGWPPAWELGGKFSVMGSLRQVHLKVDASGAGARGNLEAAATRSPAGWEADLALVLANLKPELLTSFRPAWAEPLRELPPLTARLSLKARGAAWPPEQVTGALSLDPCRFGPRHLEQAGLTFTATPREQQLTGSLKGNFGQLSLNAQGSWLTASRGDLRVQVEGLRPDLLGMAAPPETNLGGKFTGSFRLPGWHAWGEAVLAGDLEARGRIGSLTLTEAKSRLTWEKPRLTLAQVNFHLGNLKGEVKGLVEKDRLDLKFQGSLAPGGPGPLPENLRGSLNWQGSLAGDLKAPRFSLEAKGAHLAFGGLAGEELTLRLAGEGWPPRSGSLDFQSRGLGVAGLTFARATATARGSGDAWSFSLKASSPQGPQAEITGNAALGARPVEVTLTEVRGQLPQATLQNKGPVRLRLLPGLEVAPAVFLVKDGRLTLEARVREGAVAGRLEVENLPAGILALRGQPLEGRLRGSLNLTGEAGQPVLKGLLSLSPGQVGQFKFQTLQTSLAYQGNSLSLNGSLEQRPGGPRLAWDGRLPLHLSLIPFKAAWGQEDMRLSLKGEGTDLSLLAALSPEVLAAEGPVAIGADWQGPMSQPRLTGEVRWGAGSIKLRQAGTPYTLQPGVMRLQGSTLTLPQLALISDGTATISGEIRLAGFLPGDIDLKARLDNFKAVARQASEAYGTGNVTLKGPLNALSLTGKLLLPRASFRLIFFRQAIHEDIVLTRQPPPPPEGALGPGMAPGLVKNLTMDIALESTGGVWVRDPKFKAEAVGTIRAIKQPGEKVAWAGEVRSLQGTIDLQDRIFKVTEGILRMPGKPGAPMMLDVRAVHEMTDVTLVLNISGPAKRPDLKFSSIPALPPQDILAYIMFGRPVRSLNQDEYRVVNPLAVGALGGITAKKLQEFLGKDFPLVGDITLKSSETSVGVSKPLTKNLSVSVERKTVPLSRDDTNQIRLEYRINRYLGLESQMGQRNTGADVLFNFDF